jgi:hypothetical protein
MVVSRERFPENLGPALLLALVTATATGVWDYNDRGAQHTTILMLVAFGAMVSSLSFPKWWVVSSLLVAVGVPSAHITLRNLGLPAGHEVPIWESFLVALPSLAGGFIGRVMRNELNQVRK